jgi:hypothetical protein
MDFAFENVDIISIKNNDIRNMIVSAVPDLIFFYIYHIYLEFRIVNAVTLN